MSSETGPYPLLFWGDLLAAANTDPATMAVMRYFTEITEWVAGNQGLTTTLDNIDAAW
jgi:hypothetical protein